MEFFKALNRGVSRLVIGLIVLYQHTLSPDHGPFKYVYGGPVCKFHPTCSEYTAQAIREHGIRGLWAGLKRVLSCNPFSKAL